MNILIKLNTSKIILISTVLYLSSCALPYKIKKDKTVISYANTITAEELKTHLTVLASDKYEGRETGKKGQRMTAEYLKNEFIKLGLKPGNNGSYFQNFPLTETEAPQSRFQFRGKTYAYAEDFYYYQNYAKFEDFIVEYSQILPLGNGIVKGKYNDYRGQNVKGKTVIINVENPKGVKFSWKEKLKLAQEKGAKNVLFFSKYFELNMEKIHHYLTKSSVVLGKKLNEKKEYKNIPFFFISQKMEMELMMDITKEENEIPNPLKNSLIFENSKISFIITSSNVLGLIEGSDENLKNEIVILTAHYDHLGIIDGVVNNGADDDGSGTVALLELAEAFMKAKKEGNGPKRSILIMPVSGEEKGLLGSQYYVENPVFPLKNTVVDLNIDMIGRIDEFHKKSDYVYLIGADKISQELHDVSEAANRTYSKLDLDYTFNKDSDPNRFYYRSDHYNFAKSGIPVIFYFTGVHEDYHKPTDDIEKIMFPKLADITKLVFYTAWEIANKPARLKIGTKKGLEK